MASIATTESTASYTIKVDGKKLPNTTQILSIKVQNEINRIPSANLILIDGNPSNNKFDAGNGDLFVPGKTLEIWVGKVGNEVKVFKGIVVKHGIELRSSGMTRLNLLCKDALVKTTILPKRKYFIDKKDHQVIQEIIQTYAGLEVEAESTSIKHEELIQYDATDWDFIVMRAEANGRICTVENGKLIVSKPNFSTEAVITLNYGVNILDIEAEIDAREQFTNLKTKTWHYDDQVTAEATANEPTVNEIGNLSGSEIAKALGSAANWIHGGKLETKELQVYADAALLKQRMTATKGRVRSFGINVKPNQLVELKGLSNRFNGKAWVSGVQHSIEEGIWTTDIQFGWSARWFSQENDVAQMSPPSLVPPLTGLQIGVVTGLEGDPDGEERILVRMPMIDSNSDGSRARILSLDAGKERGFHFRPEIGDEVVVGFLQNDPREVIVLGSLHSSNKPSPFPFKDNNHIKGFVSRNKMALVFDDEKNIISIKTPAGNEIVLSEDQKQLTITDQNKNKITMSSDGISIESSKDLVLKAAANIKIDGVNIEQSATAQLKAEGTSIELNSSGVAILTGKPVKIN